MMRVRHEWTLSAAARLLGQPQHRLIYLCEQGVVHPDLEDARGRGSSRRFSTRNLLEFAVALRLRALELPAASIGAITYLLRAFERQLQHHQQGFRLPESLRGAGAPDLRVLISDGRFYVTLGSGKGVRKMYGGLDLRRHARASRAAGRPPMVTPLPPGPRHGADGTGGPEENGHARVEISVTRIAQELRLEM